MIIVYLSLIMVTIVVISVFQHPNVNLAIVIRWANAIVLFNSTYQFTKILHGCG